MEQRHTLDQVAKIFGVSRTCIKNSFRAVYGVSFYAFMKARNMESAAYMLSLIHIFFSEGIPSEIDFPFRFWQQLPPVFDNIGQIHGIPACLPIKMCIRDRCWVSWFRRSGGKHSM